jgi:vacuolar-type H+-ATPase subunit F/Vma7
MIAVNAVAVIGEEALIRAYAMVGAEVIAAESPPDVRDAWRALHPDVAVVVLTSAAAAALVEHQPAGGWPLVVVMD